MNEKHISEVVNLIQHDSSSSGGGELWRFEWKLFRMKSHFIDSK